MSIEESNISIFTFILESLKILASAFIGTTAAFAFERRKRKESEITRQKSILIETQFALICRLNFILVLNKQFLDDQKQNPNRWAELLPIETKPVVPEIKIGELGFILLSNNEGILTDVQLVEETFEAFIGALNTRNKFHYELQQNFATEPPSPQLKKSLTSLTNALYDLSFDLENRVINANSLLFNMIKTEYKNAKGLLINQEKI